MFFIFAKQGGDGEGEMVKNRIKIITFLNDDQKKNVDWNQFVFSLFKIMLMPC